MTTSNSWKEASVGQHVTLINGFAFPSEGFTDNGGMPLIRIRDLRNQTTEVNYHGRFDTKYVVRRGDLLIGMDGDFDTVKWKGNDALLNQRVCKLETKDSQELVQNFLFYRIIDEVIRINRITAATTVKHLSSGDVLGIRFERPPEPEQSKIAEILSTVDRAIEQTEALIAKQQRIKTGLMQDLLTRGIDQHGNLRSEETHQFKDSPLGRIPVEWNAKKLCEITDLRVGYAFKSSWFAEDGVRLLRGENVGTGKADWKDTQWLPHHMAGRYPEYLLANGNLVIGMDRTFTKQGFKVTLLGAADTPCLLVQRVGCFIPLGIPAQYMRLLIQSPQYQRELFLQQKGMDIPHLSKGEILSPLVPVPKETSEMDEIGKRVGALQVLIEDSIRHLNKLRSTKTALMQDLLTGEKRVTPLLEPAVTT